MLIIIHGSDFKIDCNSVCFDLTCSLGLCAITFLISVDIHISFDFEMNRRREK